MNTSYNDAEKEILEVERRLVQRAEHFGQCWRQARETALRKYSVPVLLGVAALGALMMVGFRRRPALKRAAPTPENTTLLAKLVALASLVRTLQRLPLEPLVHWIRARRHLPDMNRSSRPMAGSDRWP